MVQKDHGTLIVADSTDQKDHGTLIVADSWRFVAGRLPAVSRGNSRARRRQRPTPSAGLLGLDLAGVVPDVARRHHEDDVLGDVGRMVADPFEVP
jgi:hypothetical protein